MSKIIAFAGSNSETSINDQLLKYSLQFLGNHEVDYIDLKPLQVPIYSENIEKTSGIPEDIKELRSKIDECNALVVALNEHNGTMSAFFKNITDWLSRTGSYLESKKLFLLATSPGAGGAKFVLNYSVTNFEKFGGEIVNTFSLPNFNDHFKEDNLSEEYKNQLKLLLNEFSNELK